MANPDERRSRAASIFEQLRRSRSRSSLEADPSEPSPSSTSLEEVSETASKPSQANQGHHEPERAAWNILTPAPLDPLELGQEQLSTDSLDEQLIPSELTPGSDRRHSTDGQRTESSPSPHVSLRMADDLMVSSEPGESVRFSPPPPPQPAPKMSHLSRPPDPAPGSPSTHRPGPRCLAIANQKGGVGKTTTTVNLGASLAELGHRVLVVDLDPQGNATTGLGINPRNLDASVYDVILHDAPVEDVIEPTSVRNLFVVPATIDLAGAEIELVPAFSRELRLRRSLEPIRQDFDFILIDCPPSLGLLTVNGLAAASEVLVPIQCEYYALEGLGQLLKNVSLVKSNLNTDLEVSTIVLTMYDARTKLAEQVVEEVRGHFGDRVCKNIIPRTVRLSEAPSFGQPITTLDPASRGAIAYRELAKEVSARAPQWTG